MTSSDSELKKWKNRFVKYQYYYYIMLSIAIFLSVKCNNGFDPLGFIAAVAFPFLYIPYKLLASFRGCISLSSPDTRAA
jgi:hypothetical protein